MFALRSLKRTFHDETLALLSSDHKKHLDKFGGHLSRFLDGIAEPSESLAEVSQKGLLTEFLGRHRSIGDEFWESKLISNATIDDDYKDLPILLAFAHEGGSLLDLLSNNDVNGEPQIKSLIGRLLSMSPQQFISTSGLLSGINGSQMYVDLVSQLIDVKSSLMIWAIKTENMELKNPAIYWFRKMETLSGVVSRDDSLTFIADTSLLKANIAGLEAFDLDDYKQLLNQCGVKATIKNRERSFDSIFLTDAFVLLQTHQDTQAVIKNLTLKAGVWAEIMSPGRTDHERLVEQMVAVACFAHPQHFRRAGFAINNLATPHDHSMLFPDVNSLLAGPLVNFSRTRVAMRMGQKFAETRLFEYARRLVPGFDLEKLITHSGFTNRTIPAVVESVGGHHPVIDQALEGCKINRVVASEMITMIIKNKAFGAYLPSTLLQLCEVKLHDLAYRNEDGELVPFLNLENQELPGIPVFEMKTRDIEATRDRLFLPAYAQNPAFKGAMIDHLIAQPGITANHLVMTGIGIEDNPEILRKMHLKDRGDTFHNALGI